MEVEVKQPEGFYLKAAVNDITDEGLDVVYEKGWRKPEIVKFEQCRAVVAESGQKLNFKVGDIVDAYVRIDKSDKDEVMGWNKMKIRDIKNDFAVVESVERTQMGDIIPISQCRHPALPTSVSASSVKSLTIELNDDLLDYFSRSEENYKVIQQSIPAILIKFNRQEKTLVVKTFSAASIKKVEVLKDVFLANCRQKMMMLQRHEEQKKMLSVHEPQPDSPFVVEFDVSTAFMGLAIGAQGANISNARSLDGITEIKLDESTREQGFSRFKIFAQKAEAAEQARNMLEFLAQQKFVPKNKVGQVIGKQGKTIQDIVDKSGVVRVQIGDDDPDQAVVPFSFTGTREAITHAELLVEFHLKHINEMDEIRAEEEEIRRKLYHSRNSPFQHFNGHPHQQQYQNQGGGGGRQYQQNNNNNMRGAQNDGERRGGGYRGGGQQQQRGGQQQRGPGGGGQMNRYNGGGGAGGVRSIGGGASGRPYNNGGSGGGSGRFVSGGGRQYSAQQYRGGGNRGDQQQQKMGQRDQQQPQRNVNSSPKQPSQQESEGETADNDTFNSGQPAGSDDNSEKSNEKSQPTNSTGPSPPHHQQRQNRNMTGGFGNGRTVGHGPARNRRSKADDE